MTTKGYMKTNVAEAGIKGMSDKLHSTVSVGFNHLFLPLIPAFVLIWESLVSELLCIYDMCALLYWEWFACVFIEYSNNEEYSVGVKFCWDVSLICYCFSHNEGHLAHWSLVTYMRVNGPLTRYVKLRVAHAPGVPGNVFPATDFKGDR